MSRGAISYSWLSTMLILGSLLGLFVLRSFGLTLRQTALLKMSEGALLKQVSHGLHLLRTTKPQQSQLT